jgi:serine/threonine protein kinase
MAESQIAHGPTLAAEAPPRGDGDDRLPAGASAGDYLVERFLGAGAMGDVYAGRHPVIGKRVAIKVLKRELAASPEAAERFIREAQAVNQIDHPNVIDVFGFGRLDDGRLYLVMDLVDGRSLRKAVQDGPLAVDAALDVLAQIADALDAAHARGVVHRDLKPDNVMLTNGTPSKVLVLDFGIAKLAAVGATGNGTLTGKGTWLGTPGYMAPEQWSADGAGPASDRYALGVMAYELLSGALPFQAPTLPQMMEQHFRAPVPALSMRGNVTHHQTLDPVLARAMAKSPDARFSTARELVEALRDAADGRAMPRGSKDRRSLVAPAVAGASVLGLAVVGFFVVRDGNPQPEQRPNAPLVSPDGFVRIQVITQPPKATVMRGDQLVGSSPATLEVRAGTPLALKITKPGYRTIDEALAPGTDAVVRKELQPINTFEGVWAMPDGQLRAFQRVGEEVAVSKLQTVTGEREFWRKFELVESPSGVVFATNAELTDDRGARDPSCQIQHRIEYHFDPEHATLDVRAERVETARKDGRCFVRAREPGTPIALVRADGKGDETRWTQPPVGKPIKGADIKLPKDTLDNFSDVQQKTPPTVDPKEQELSKKQALDKKTVLKSRPQKLRPPINTGNAPKAPINAKQAPNQVDTKNAPVNAEGKLANQPPPQDTGAQAPQQAPPQPPPQAKPQTKAPPQQAPNQPRGDSQVAPQIQQQTGDKK